MHILITFDPNILQKTEVLLNSYIVQQNNWKENYKILTPYAKTKKEFHTKNKNISLRTSLLLNNKKNSRMKNNIRGTKNRH